MELNIFNNKFSVLFLKIRSIVGLNFLHQPSKTKYLKIELCFINIQLEMVFHFL